MSAAIGLNICRGISMSRGAVIAALLFLLALDVVVLALNVSQQSRAAGAGVKYQDLVADPDFVRAVKSIAEKCRVNVDLGRLECGAD
jgi:hypothetical protein